MLERKNTKSCQPSEHQFQEGMTFPVEKRKMKNKLSMDVKRSEGETREVLFQERDLQAFLVVVSKLTKFSVKKKHLFVFF